MLPVPRRDVVERTVLLPPDLDVASIELVDRDGAAVPFAVVRADRMARVWGPAWQELPSRRQREILRRYRAQFPQWFGDRTREHDLLATIQYVASLPSLGVASVEVRPRDGAGAAPVHLPDRLAVGDDVLRQTAALITGSVRQSDVFARYGGEEFALVFPDTDMEAARRACEKICRSIEAWNWSSIHPELQVTISIGIAEASEVSDWEKLTARADTRLYEAKRAGKNRVIAG